MAAQGDPVVERLESLRKERPEWGEIARIYSVVLPLIQEADLQVSSLALTREVAAVKLAQGTPLLQGEALDFDEWAARTLLIQLARAVENVPADVGHTPRWIWIRGDRRKKPRGEMDAEKDGYVRATSARQIRLMLERGDLEAGRLLGFVAAGDVASVISQVDDKSLDPGLLWTLAQHALKPALRIWAAQSNSLVDLVGWHHDYCPICGTDALLGELQGNAGELHARCGQCGADWKMPRLDCVHCGTNDPEIVKHLYAEEEREPLRVQICDSCHGYFKMVAAFSPNRTELLPVIDLATIHLDMIAQARGYARGLAILPKVLDF